jgi:hypothetical protein
LAGRETGGKADHSPQSSGKVKDAWIYTSIPPNDFMAWCLIKHSYVHFRAYAEPNGKSVTNDEMVREWLEATVANFMSYPSHFSEASVEIRNTSMKVAGTRLRIRSEDLTNKKQEC